MYPVLFEIPNLKSLAPELLILEVVLAVAATLAWVALRVRSAQTGRLGGIASTIAILLALHIALSFFMGGEGDKKTPITIYSFGVVIILGFLAAAGYITRQTDRLRLPSQKIFDWAFWCLVVGIVGARVLYAWLDADKFSQNKFEIFRIWNGGLVWYGGLIPAAFVGVWLLNRYKLPVLHVADAGAAGLMLALGIGRWACLLAGDDYGTPTDSWIGIRFYNERALVADALRGVALHPTQLYMSVNCLWLFFVLEWIRRKSRYAGQTFAAMIILYAVTRAAFIEPFRGDFAERNPSYRKHMAVEVTLSQPEGSPAVTLERGTPVHGGDHDGRLMDDVTLDAGADEAQVWALSDGPAKTVQSGGMLGLTGIKQPEHWGIARVDGVPDHVTVSNDSPRFYDSDLGRPPGYVSTSQGISIAVVLGGIGLLFLVRRLRQPGFTEAVAATEPDDA